MEGNENTNAHQIVVGVDGSPSSQAALRWALREARHTAATVRAVTAWEVPRYEVAPDLAEPSVEKAARDTLAATLEGTGEDTAGIGVEPQVVHGHPAHVLVRSAAHADLLVVGSRGHGTLTGLLLGSVSDYCVHHAPCPVVVVRGGEDRA